MFIFNTWVLLLPVATSPSDHHALPSPPPLHFSSIMLRWLPGICHCCWRSFVSFGTFFSMLCGGPTHCFLPVSLSLFRIWDTFVFEYFCEELIGMPCEVPENTDRQKTNHSLQYKLRAGHSFPFPFKSFQDIVLFTVGLCACEHLCCYTENDIYCSSLCVCV